MRAKPPLPNWWKFRRTESFIIEKSHRQDQMDADLKTLITTLIEGQIRTDRSVGELATLVGRSHDLLEAADSRLEAAHLRTEEVIRDFAASADARMRRIEENLDGLIRAITRDHSNGKGH